MPTSSTQDSKSSSPKLLKLGDRLTGIGKKASNAYLDRSEKTITTVTDFQRKLAGKSRVGRVETILEAQADLTSDVAKATTSAVRKVLA
jgi:hypothetical protein